MTRFSRITPAAALILAGLMAAFAPASAQEKSAAPSRYAVYYDSAAPLGAFEPYDLLVLDSDYHPDLKALSERGKTLLGYLSLGEAEQQRLYFKRLKEKGLTLHENKYWPGSYFIDVRNPAWAKLVVDDLIPYVLKKGFDGIFIDTLDNPLELERAHPQKYKGMRQATIDLIKAIRTQYPDMKIMLNRAYGILPEVAPMIDMVLGESVYHDYNFSTKTYGKVEQPSYEQQVKWLKEAKARNPALGVYTLDYTEKDDTETIRAIYEEQRKNGFIPYVATLKLNELVPEPEAK